MEDNVQIPRPWKQCFDYDGYPYYWNEKTHESVWELSEVFQAVDREKLEEKIASQTFADVDPAQKPRVVDRQSRNRGASSPISANHTVVSPNSKIPSFDSLPSVPVSNATFDDRNFPQSPRATKTPQKLAPRSPVATSPSQNQMSSVQSLKAEPVQSSAVQYSGLKKVMTLGRKKSEPLVPQDIVASPKVSRRSRTVGEESKLPRYSEIYGSMPALQNSGDTFVITPGPQIPARPSMDSMSPNALPKLVKSKSASSSNASPAAVSPSQRSHAKSVDELDTRVPKTPFSPDTQLKMEGSDPRIGLPLRVRHVGHFETDDFAWTKKTPTLDKRGYLHLKLNQSWDSRYIAIRKGFMYVYKDSSEISLILNLKLKDSKIETDDTCGKPHVIRLTTVAKESLTLAAPTERELSEWRCAIKINGAIDEEFAISEERAPAMRIGERRNPMGVSSGSK